MIIAGDRVLIGVSGGPDSLALLYFLDKFKEGLAIELGVAHLHHQLRGRQADADEAFVMEFCRERGIPFFSIKKDIATIAKKKKISIEEAGRHERHAFLNFLASEEGFDRIALGHHLNDQAETMLMRLIRGSGVKGLGGMKANRDSLLIRPFLFLGKKDLVAYCEKNKLAFRTDASNFAGDYTRNKIRLEIMPAIRTINPQADQHFFDFSQIASGYEEFLQAYVDQIEGQILYQEDGLVHFDRRNWLKEKAIVQSELLRRGIIQFKGSLKEIEYNHIMTLQNLLRSDKTSSEIHLPGGIKVVRRYNQVRIEDRITPAPLFYSPRLIIPNKTYIIAFFRLILEVEQLDQGYFEKNKKISLNHKNDSEKYFDYDKIGGDLYLRTRARGDFFYPPGLAGKKTIKKFLIDRKVEREKRSLIPLLAVENEVLWVIGYGINERLLIDETSSKILRVKIRLC